MRSAAPTGDAGNAVERLQDEQCHILELFDTYTRRRRDGDPAGLAEANRLATLIYTLLRVHCELEQMLLHPALAQDPGLHPALAQTSARRRAMLDALEDTEALSPRDPAHAQAMATLAQRVRGWFHEDQRGIFARLRASRLDLEALDRQMADRQEALLSAGGNSRGLPSAPP